MNHLAHAWFAWHSEDAILAAMLGDFARGPVEALPWPGPVRDAIRRHRHIDQLADAHPRVVAARALFPKGRRRFAGIVLDVHFDHLLARDWVRWNPGPGALLLPAFAARVYRLLLAHLPALPPRLQAIAPRMAAHDWLGGMHMRGSVDGTVRAIARRLTRGGDALVACLDDLRRHEAAIDAAFEALPPDSVAASDPAPARGTAR